MRKMRLPLPHRARARQAARAGGRLSAPPRPAVFLLPPPAAGSGVSVIEVGFQYNLNVTAAWPSFVVNPFVTKVRSEVDLKQNLLYGLLFPGLHR